MRFGLTEDARGKRVRAKGGTEAAKDVKPADLLGRRSAEVATLLEYKREGFYLAEVTREGRRVEIIVHEDDVVLA